MEVVKFQQAQLINSDLDMYYARTDTPALCRTSALVEELGQIEYVFSDKTGTLTCNEMEFRCCSVAGTAYADVVDDTKREGEDGRGGWRTFAEMRDYLNTPDNPFVDQVSSSQDHGKQILKEFLTLLAVCHTVIPEVQDGKMVYQASSPDEAALVAGAEQLGYQFHVSHKYKLPSNIQLTLCADSKTEICLREHPRRIPRIRNFESLRIQFDEETHVYSYQISRWNHQDLYQGCRYSYFGASKSKSTVYRDDSCSP